ncbi:MAG TPA: restriction endonuclease subunit S [Firmicutes bacterium]|nr:restriction endonuclease subunit S [Bacillota bacterium]
MGKWPLVRLGDVATVVSGSTPKTSVEEYWNGNNCWVTPAELSDEVFVINDTNRKITDLAVKDTGLKPLPKGTVLLSSRAPIGKVAITGHVMYCNQGFKNLICGESIYNKYLFWFLKGKTEYLNSLGRGATFKEISKKIVEDIKIPLPCIDIQKHIANTLDKTQEIIDGHKKQLAELDDLIKAVFYEMFGDPVANEKGWEIKTLKDVCNKITDGTHHSPLNYEKGDYKYITAKNIKKDGFDLSQLTYVTKADHKEIYSRCNPQFGDILYIKDGVTTGIAQINTLHEEFSMLSSIALLKQKREIVNNYYLREVLNNDIMYAHVRRNMGGAAITRLTIKKIELIQIPLPPLTLQTKFANIVTKIEEEKALVKQAITESEHLFNSLMNEYFD